MQDPKDGEQLSGSDRVAEVIDVLEDVAEQLADVAMEVLRSAIDSERPGAGAAASSRERVINRARGAVERATHLLKQVIGGETS